MQRLEDSGAVRPIYGSLGVKRLKKNQMIVLNLYTNNSTGRPLITWQIPRHVCITAVSNAVPKILARRPCNYHSVTFHILKQVV